MKWRVGVYCHPLSRIASFSPIDTVFNSREYGRKPPPLRGTPATSTHLTYLETLVDSYQPIYDAVRSRISGCDVGQAVESAFREANLSHHVAMAAESAREAAAEHYRPSVLFKPALSIDGDQWCALYGDDLQCGVAGFGDSPAEAMLDFDRQWVTKLSPAKG